MPLPTTSTAEPTILNVYFGGTGGSVLDLPTTQVGKFYQADTGANIRGVGDNSLTASHLKMGFNGCGVDYGFRGTLWGHGLKKQCNEVITRVISLLRAGKHVKLNVFGLSRGAIAAILLAKRLGQIDSNHLEQNLMLVDPVPGNFITTQKIDFTHRSLARQTMDMSRIKNLGKVLALYPTDPLSTILCHAPLLPTYPDNINLEEDYVSGCHQGALFNNSEDNSALSRTRIHEFMTSLGAKYKNDHSLQIENSEQILDRLGYLKLSAAPTHRAIHSKRNAEMVCSRSGQYVNYYHHRLTEEAANRAAPIPLAGENYQRHLRNASGPIAPNVQNRTEVQMNNIQKDLLGFAQALFKTVGRKGEAKHQKMGGLVEELKTTLAITPDQARIALRKILAVALQRQGNPWSPFHTSGTGMKAKKLFNTEFRSLKPLLGTNKDIRYRDLRAFVLGSNDKKYFNSNKMQDNFACMKALLTEDGFSSFIRVPKF